MEEQELNTMLVKCSDFDELKVRYVKLDFLDISNQMKLVDEWNLIEYLQTMSNYALKKEIVTTVRTSGTTLSVIIRCGSYSEAQQFLEKLKSVNQECDFVASIVEPHLKAQIDEFMEYLLTASDDVSLEIDENIKSYRNKLEDIKKELRKGILLENYKTTCLLEVVYADKIKDLEKQKEEFLSSKESTRNLLQMSMEDEKLLTKEKLKDIKNLFEIEKSRCRNGLPIYNQKSEVVKTITDSQVTILIGETGSGKTTQIVQYLYEAWPRSEKIIVCTQPRKVAAVSVADRVAQELNCTLGQLVGYQVGLNKKISKSTRILFMTDHMLLNECLNDKFFSKYCCIILDEAHERTIFTDLLLGFIKKILLFRKDLKLVITSATIEPFRFLNYFKDFQPPLLKVSGKLFPVQIIYEIPTYPKDHVSSACNKAIELHWKEGIPGDILVFLTSPSETEQAVEFFKSRNPKNAQVLALHGRLQVEEQQEVLNPTKSGFRKIVFATNAAETSLTIPGIKYVVDSGMVREVAFDGSKNMSSLVLTKISKSSADQRKGRAGRTESGVCYRLYSEQEFNEMPPTTLPEILKVHLGQSLLKVMMLGINDPKEFDFVEAPPVESIDIALKLLNDLGAVGEDGITELGKKLASLSLEPRLSKVVLMGVENNVGYECVVISALSSVGNQIFYRGCNDENKFQSDKRKSAFCDDYGDMITLLNVYKEWLSTPYAQRSTWCYENFVNSKKITATRETIREMIHSLNSELHISISETFSEESDVNAKISKIIFKCFYYNLARYTGHRKIGFRLVGNPELALNIHPSSSLTYMEEYPNWIVFYSILTTSQNYVLGVTFVKQSWVDEMIETNALNYTQTQLDRIVLISAKLCDMGTHLREILTTPVAPNYKNIVEECIHTHHPNALAILDLDYKPFVFLYASSCEFEKVLTTVQGELCRQKLNLLNDTLVVTAKPGSNIKVILSQGGSVVVLLMPNERSQLNVKIRDDADKFSTSAMGAFIKKMAGVIKVFWIRGKNECLVTFAEPSCCSNFLDLDPGFVHPNFVHFSSIISNDNVKNLSNISVKVTLIRRPVKGYGFVYFKSIEKCESFTNSHALITVRHHGMKWDILTTSNRKSQDQVYIKDLPPWITNFHVMDAFKKAGVPEEDIVKVIIPREPPPDKIETAIQIEGFKYRLLKLSSGIDERDITIIEPHNDKDYYLLAYINCTSSYLARKIIYSINSNSDDIYFMRGELEIKCTYFTPSKFFNKSKIDAEFTQLKADFKDNFTMANKFPNNLKQNVRTILTAQTAEGLFEAKERFDPLLLGVKWEVPFYRHFHSKKYENLKRELEVKHDVFISFEEQKRCIVIYGNSENIKQTKRNIEDELSKQTNNITKELDLRNGQYARGLMKSLIRQYGCELLHLQNETGAVDLDIDLKKHQLIFLGNQEAYEKLESILRNLSNTIEANNSMNGETGPSIDYHTSQRADEDLGECPICLDRINFSDYYVTEYCGHIYCKDCITNLIKNNCQQSNFPIKCIKEQCNSELVLKDLQNLIVVADDFQTLVQASVRYLQAQNSDKYAFCPTPDCTTVFKKQQASDHFLYHDEFICNDCHCSICTSCGSTYHFGMSCTTFKKHFNTADEVLKKWLKSDPKLRSICPKCGFGIEKNGGCNHVECLNCKIHICWVCKDMFKESTLCYDHMKAIHNGIQDGDDDDDDEDEILENIYRFRDYRYDD